MATIEVKATILLQEAIILATQQELEYPEVEMQTVSGSYPTTGGVRGSIVVFSRARRDRADDPGRSW